MKSVYQVRREDISLYHENTQEVVFETTRKREAERWINSMYRCYKMLECHPIWVRGGYFQLPDFSCEYFICKTAKA